jgi:hypothetical protein
VGSQILAQEKKSVIEVKMDGLKDGWDAYMKQLQTTGATPASSTTASAATPTGSSSASVAKPRSGGTGK